MQSLVREMGQTANKISRLNEVKAALPDLLWDAVVQFMVDKNTGNIVINIQEGKILGYHVKEIVSLKQ